MEYIFIINPFAGRGRGEKLIPLIRETMEGAGYPYQIYITQAAGDAERYVRAVCEKGEPVRFYVCGGDGSMHEVVNGARGFSQVEIGLFPVGTGNDFVRNFGEKELFLDVLSQVRGESVFCDAILLNDRYVVNMANIGFDCEVVVEAGKWKKKPFIGGPAAYLLGILSEFSKPIGKWMSFRREDGTTLTEKCLLCTIANGSFCGGGFCSSPKASLSDGLMDVGVVKMIPRRKFVGILPKYKKGTYLETKLAKERVLYEKYSRLELAVEEPMNISVDGEIRQFTYLKAEIVSHAFRFIVPVKEVNKK